MELPSPCHRRRQYHSRGSPWVLCACGPWDTSCSLAWGPGAGLSTVNRKTGYQSTCCFVVTSSVIHEHCHGMVENWCLFCSTSHWKYFTCMKESPSVYDVLLLFGKWSAIMAFIMPNLLWHGNNNFPLFQVSNS